MHATQATIDAYREHGYALIQNLFDVGELDATEQAFDDLIERRRATNQQVDVTWAGAWKDAEGPTEIFDTHDVQQHDARLARLLFDERLTGIMADLLGTPNVQLHHTKLFLKPPEHGSGFPMHQDYPYFPHEAHSMMAAIIHLTDATEEMGCVRVIPGSHKLGPIECAEHKHLDPEVYPLAQATPIAAGRGDVLFFNYLTIHGSGPNRSQRERKTLLIQVRDPADRPLEAVHVSHAQGMMLRGVCPLGART